MKKSFLLLFVLIVISACEKDDFCSENPVTPNLILRFYDDANRNTIKRANDLTVWAENRDSIYIDQNIDSLVIPLNSIANQTVYNLSKDNIVNQITVNYTPENIYVSRSCGYKVNFNDVTFSSNNTWITEISSTTTVINNQNEAHVQIFH